MANYLPGSTGLLAPLQPWLADPLVSELLVNQPGEVWVERHGRLKAFAVPPLNAQHIHHLCQLIANENGQRLSHKTPLLSGSLQDGSRVQVCLAPTAKHTALSIRRKVVRHLALADYEKGGFFCRPKKDAKYAALLRRHYMAANWGAFLREAIRQKKTIVISGGTSSGKTTLLNACLQEIPQTERLLLLEDTRELEPPHPNQVSLVASKGDQAEAQVSMQDLVQCCLRLRPDRILMGEIRGAEMLDFIAACSTGHEGSMTSIHANNPPLAFQRMIQMVKLNNVPSMTDGEILAQLKSVIDVIIQVDKTPEGRRLTDVYFGEMDDAAH